MRRNTHQFPLCNLCCLATAVVIQGVLLVKVASMVTLCTCVKSRCFCAVNANEGVACFCSCQRNRSVIIPSADASPVHEESSCFDLDSASVAVIEDVLDVHGCFFKACSIRLLYFVTPDGRHHSKRSWRETACCMAVPWSWVGCMFVFVCSCAVRSVGSSSSFLLCCQGHERRT